MYVFLKGDTTKEEKGGREKEEAVNETRIPMIKKDLR